jgi:acetyl esterase/lipase
MKKKLLTIFALCLLLFSGCSPTPAEPTATPLPPTDIPAEPDYADLPYLDDGKPTHILDIYLPDDASAPLPTLFFMHGSMDSKNDHKEVLRYFAEKGYVVVATEYQAGGGMSSSISDVFCSLAWVHTNANEYGIDTEQIYLYGYSLGGYLAAILAAIEEPGNFMQDCPYTLPDENRTAGSITFGGFFVTQEVCMSPQEGWCMAEGASANGIPLTEMMSIFEALRETPYTEWRGNTELSTEALNFAETLPLYWVHGDMPPFLIIHGAKDEIIPMRESEAFTASLESVGADVEFVNIPEASHFSMTMNSPSFEKISKAVLDFLEK